MERGGREISLDLGSRQKTGRLEQRSARHTTSVTNHSALVGVFHALQLTGEGGGGREEGREGEREEVCVLRIRVLVNSYPVVRTGAETPAETDRADGYSVEFI